MSGKRKRRISSKESESTRECDSVHVNRTRKRICSVFVSSHFTIFSFYFRRFFVVSGVVVG